MIIVRYLLTTMYTELKFSTNTVQCGVGPYKGYIISMVDLNEYDLRTLNGKN